MANRLRDVKLHENLFSIIEIKSLFCPPIVRKRPIFYVIGKTPVRRAIPFTRTGLVASLLSGG